MKESSLWAEKLSGDQNEKIKYLFLESIFQHAVNSPDVMPYQRLCLHRIGPKLSLQAKTKCSCRCFMKTIIVLLQSYQESATLLLKTNLFSRISPQCEG